MIRTKNKSLRKSNYNKTNSINQKKNLNIILVSHSKNKSVDLKRHKKYNLLLSSNNVLKNSKNKSNVHKTSPNIIDLKKSHLKKYGSVPNLVEKNKKKFFFDDNFFNKKLKKTNNSKNNIVFTKNFSSKKQDNSKIDKYIRRIIKRKNNNNIIPNGININKKQEKDINNNDKIINKNNENIKCDNSNIDNSLYDKNAELKNSLIKSNLIYIKNKINKNIYTDRKCSSSRIKLLQKEENKFKDIINNKKNESIIKCDNYLLNDSLESHNTVYDEDLNVDYNLAYLINNSTQNNNLDNIMNEINNLDNKNNKKNSNDKLYKKIITRKRNIISASFNNSNSHKNLSKSYSKKNYTINNIPYRTGKNLSNPHYNLKSQIIYRTINSKKMPLILSNGKFNDNNSHGMNFFTSSSYLTTKYQTNKCKDKDKDNSTNVIVNKDVTEFLYFEDLIESNNKYQDTNIKIWLSDMNLSIYYQNFYENNIFNVNELIQRMKNIDDKKKLYEDIENNFRIHIPGHIYRILCKLEIDSGLIDNKISNFFILKNDEYAKNINKMKPSLLLKQYNSCENFFNCPKDKNNLKNFLKKYHLIIFYYNFCQNGFDLINYVILQMFSNYYSIDDYILENHFHIYNKNDRILVLDSLLKEKEEILLFLNSDEYKLNDENDLNINYFNYNRNNKDNFLIAKESEDNTCNICFIY